MSQLFLFDDDSSSENISDSNAAEFVEQIQEEDKDTKACRICNKLKNIDDFFLDRGKAYSKCKDCFSVYQKGLREAKKSAPEKPLTCECCGKVPEKWICDHYPNTDNFRGWVCSNCNLAAGYVGDSYEGAVQLVNYLYKRKNIED
jgi:hypothetical protein